MKAVAERLWGSAVARGPPRVHQRGRQGRAARWPTTSTPRARRLTVADVRPGRRRRGRRAHRCGRGGSRAAPTRSRATSTRPCALGRCAVGRHDPGAAGGRGGRIGQQPARHAAGRPADRRLGCAVRARLRRERGRSDQHRRGEGWLRSGPCRGAHPGDPRHRPPRARPRRRGGHHHRGGRRPARRAPDRRGTDERERGQADAPGGTDDRHDVRASDARSGPTWGRDRAATGGRRTGGPVPTADDLSVLHLHDRHTELGLAADDLVGMYRTILTARVLDQKIWSLNRMGKAAFVVSGQGHEGAQVGSAWALRAGHDIVLPYYRDTGVMLTLGHDRGADPARRAGPRRRPEQRGPADAEPLGLGRGQRDHRLVADRHPAAARRRPRLRRQAPRRGHGWRSASSARGPPRRATSTRRSTSPGIHQLPMVFVCENNGYAISVPMSVGVGRRRRRRPRPRLRLRRRDRRRQRPARRVRRRALGRAPRPPRRRPHPRRVQDLPLPRPHLRRRRPHLPHAAGGRGVAQEGPAAPHHPVPHRAAAALRGRRGAHRGRGEGRGRRGRQGGRGVARRRSPTTAYHRGVRPTRCGPRPARRRAPATRPRRRSRCRCPRAAPSATSSTPSGGRSSGSWPPTTGW